MNFHKTTEYSFRIMSLLAKDEGRLYKADDIYYALHIPWRYLRKLLTLLNKKGLLESIQGKNGGYKLFRTSDDITLLDIVDAMNDSVFNTNCFFGYETCAFDKHCYMHDKWLDIKKSIEEMLENTSLSDLKKNNIHDFVVRNTLISH